MLPPSLKANIQDGLNFLLEINIEREKLDSGKISEEQFLSFLKDRSVQWRYISESKHTFKTLNKLNDVKEFKSIPETKKKPF